MIRQFIRFKQYDWCVFIYYNVGRRDFAELADSLYQMQCPKKDIKKAISVLKHKNTGFTFTNNEYRASVVCIGKATDVGQFIDTLTHEVKHLQSHICQYYDIEEDTETAAYMMGHLVHKMYQMFGYVLRSYI